MNEHKLTDTFVIRRDAFARPGVEQYQLVEGNGNVRMVTSAGTITDVAALGRALVAFAGGLTVGAALALPEVQRGEAVIEYVEDGDCWQARFEPDGELVERLWYENGPRGPTWFGWRNRRRWLRDDFARLCRLVPLAAADADPATRGAL